MKKVVTLFLFTLLPFVTELSAQEFEIDGIRYLVTDSTRFTVEVIPNASHYVGSIAIPASVTYHSKNYLVTGIYERAFEDCLHLISVIIPNSVKTIGVAAFSGCLRLTSVTMHNGVVLIDEGAFYSCSGLTSIVIPNSVTTIGDVAFWGCSALRFITISSNINTIGRYIFSGCIKLTSVTIPNSVVVIDEGAFYGCSNLSAVSIGNSVKTIRSYAFINCSNLTAVTCLNPTPPALEEFVFWGIDYSSANLYVPEGSISSYIHADQWHHFNHFLVIE